MHADDATPLTFPAAVATLVTLLTLCWRERCPERRRSAEAAVSEAMVTILAMIDLSRRWVLLSSNESGE